VPGYLPEMDCGIQIQYAVLAAIAFGGNSAL
jgi:hypothetical protein